jgi:hypothetical protein
MAAILPGSRVLGAKNADMDERSHGQSRDAKSNENIYGNRRRLTGKRIKMHLQDTPPAFRRSHNPG